MEGEGRSMGHRQLVPDLGRFISRDPIGFQGGLNLFNGAGANPVTMVDPSGLEGLLMLHTTRYCGAHSWIEYRPSKRNLGPLNLVDPAGSGKLIGDSITWGTRKGTSIQTNVEKQGRYGSTSSIGAWLTDEQEQRLFSFLSRKYPTWAHDNNCSNFARTAWQMAGQTPIRGFHWNSWGISTPWGVDYNVGAENPFPYAADGGPKASSSSGGSSSSSSSGSSTSTPEDVIYGSSFWSSASSIFGSSAWVGSSADSSGL